MNEKPTATLLKERAKEAVLKGIKAIYDPVRLTIGPEGSNALLYRTFGRGSRICNDGVTIAEVIEPKDDAVQLVSSAFKEAAKKTNQKAGDGTTSTVVIAGKLAETAFGTQEDSGIEFGGLKQKGVMTVKREIQEAAKQAIEKVKERAKKVESLEELERIATVSVESEELGKTIAKLAWEIGVDGFMDVAEGYKGEIETELIKGMRFPAKVGAKAFVNNQARFEMIAQDTPCLVTNFAFDNTNQINAFTQNLKTGKLAIFAPSFSEQVLIGLVAAFKKGFHVFPVATAALRTEQYIDLSTYLGASFINKERGMKLESVKESDLGFAEKIVVKDVDAKEDAVVVGGGGEKEREVKVGKDLMKQESLIQEHIKVLKSQVEETKVDIHKKLLEKRIASMSSAIGIIRVGASSDAEALYLIKKVEDAAYACKAALQEGYVKGGGLCLKEIAEELPETLLTPALKAPYEQIQSNADGNLEIPDTVIDPAKVVRLSVEHAVSVVSNLLTVKIIVPEVREKSPSEGYEDIAKAINFYNLLWNKKEAVFKENELEMKLDQAARTQEILASDNG